MDYLEEQDKLKTRMLKYIFYKKRTEQEVRQKFSNCDNKDMLEGVIEYLKQQDYINDKRYIEKAIQEYKSIKNMSIKEISYKLLYKGIDRNLLEEYINNNEDDLFNYELKSAKTIMMKKKDTQNKETIINALMKKGYSR